MCTDHDEIRIVLPRESNDFGGGRACRNVTAHPWAKSASGHHRVEVAGHVEVQRSCSRGIADRRNVTVVFETDLIADAGADGQHAHDDAFSGNPDSLLEGDFRTLRKVEADDDTRLVLPELLAAAIGSVIRSHPSM
jgi:hypothetical protein